VLEDGGVLLAPAFTHADSAAEQKVESGAVRFTPRTGKQPAKPRILRQNGFCATHKKPLRPAFPPVCTEAKIAGQTAR
jgi:hypothetical protein